MHSGPVKDSSEPVYLKKFRDCSAVIYFTVFFFTGKFQKSAGKEFKTFFNNAPFIGTNEKAKLTLLICKLTLFV